MSAYKGKMKAFSTKNCKKTINEITPDIRDLKKLKKKIKVFNMKFQTY